MTLILPRLKERQRGALFLEMNSLRSSPWGHMKAHEGDRKRRRDYTLAYSHEQRFYFTCTNH